jgi:hypothetical protein
MLLGYGPDYKTDNTFWNKAEEIPGGHMIQREIVNAVSGKPFFYNDPDNHKPVRLQGVNFEEFYYYYLIWEDWHGLKVLPHGKGTLAERRWVIDIIKIFEKVYDEVRALREEWLARKMRAGK